MRRKQTRYLIVIALLAFLTAPSAWGDLSDGLVAWWPFQGNPNDGSGNGHDGVAHGVTLTQDRFGNPDSAYQFDGINDYIDIGTGVKPGLAMTVGAWVKLDTLVAGQNPVFRNDLDQTASNDYRYGVALFAGSWATADEGYIDAHIYEGFSAPWNRRNKVSDDGVVDTGSWHHLAAVYGSINDIRLYWDAVEIAGQYQGTGSSLLYSAGGHGALGLTSGVYFDGIMDDVMVYNRALSQEEIEELVHPVPLPGAFLLGSIGLGFVGTLLRRWA